MSADVRRAQVKLAAATCLAATLGLGSPAPAAQGPSRSFRTAPPPAWVSPLPADLAARTPVDEIDGGTHHLLLDTQARVGRGSLEVYSHFAERAVNDAGLENVSQISVDFDPAYERLTIHRVRLHRAGAILDRLRSARTEVLQREPELESRLYDGRLTAVLFLEDVRVGDVVEWDYTLAGANPVFEGRFADSFWVEWSEPLADLGYRLLWPADRPLAVRNHRTSIAPTVRRGREVHEYLWRVKDGIPVRAEGDAPPWHVTWAWVQLSEWASWEAVREWGARLYQPAPPDAALDEMAARWEREHATPEARILAALRFVQDEVRYLGIEMGPQSHRPTEPGTVLRRRFGDCKDKARLLSALLARMGVECWPAMVHGRRGAALDDSLPTPLAFNHVVACVEHGGRRLWLDPTLSAQGGRLDTTPFPDYGRALLLRPGEVGLAAPPVPDVSKPTTTVTETLVSRDFAAPAELTIVSRYDGRDADTLRRDFQARGRETIGKSYVDYYTRHYPSIRALGPVGFEDDRERNVFTTRERYSIPSFWSTYSDPDRRETELYLATAGSYVSQPKTTQRAAPLAVEHPVHVRHVTEAVLPEGQSFASDAWTLDSREMCFSYRVAGASGRLKLEYEYRSLAAAVPPDRVAGHLDGLAGIRDRMSYLVSYPPLRSRARGEWLPAGAVLVLAALFAPGALAGAWAARRFQRRRAAGEGAPAARLGGVLILLAALLVALVALRATLLAHPGAPYTEAAWERVVALPLGTWVLGPLVLLAYLGRVVLFVAAALLTVLLLERRRSFSGAFVALGVAQIVLLFGETPVLAGLGDIVSAQTLALRVADCAASAVLIAGWSCYVMLSRRAARTLVL